MRFDLKQMITDFSALINNYIERDGYLFSSWSDRPSIFDVLVIKQPNDANGNTRIYPNSSHSLNEHIRLINEENIERALIIADDISFITECPSLKMLSVFPSNFAAEDFDYSPLYRLPKIKSLNCHTVYGEREEKSCSIDYSKFSGLTDLGVYGKGHLNYESLKTLEKLWASNMKNCENLYQVSHSNRLKDLTVLQCVIKSLDGIEQYHKLQSLVLSNNRLLNDISTLSKVNNSLRLLSIEGCPKIADFSCLYDLSGLEHLSLVGSNILPNLQFLRRMTRLKTFTFSMEISDGDLSPCLQIPYVSCAKSKKWYNIKNKELPKQKPTEPFRVT